MKIYSWNMLFRNRELDRAFKFIAESDFDIFCLQEVPSEFLARLKTLPYHLAETTSIDRHFRRVIRDHVVILSRYPITSTGTIALSDYWSSLPWRTKLFVRFMRPFHWTRIDNRHGLYADLAVSGQSLRVFNLHILLSRPTSRVQEFEEAMIRRDPSRPTIVCGDFNTIESPFVSVLNWLVGGTIEDSLLYRRERTQIEKRFVAHELINPLRGSVTHSFARSQLDHILVSNSFSIQKAEVMSDRIGSDHHPIFVELV